MHSSKLFMNLFRGASTVDFSLGQTIFEADAHGDTMFVILEGEVEIVIGTSVLEKLGPGCIFGEMALIDDGPRSARAVATKDSRLAPVNRRRFEFMVQETPFFALEVMTILADRLRRTNALVTESQRA